MRHSVLVVDDDQDIRQILCTLLQLSGFQTFEAIDGEDGLNKVREHQPDVIVLDVMMPVMDGITMCCLLRQEPATAALPIIMLSGKASSRDVQAGLDAGANKYLTKPTGLDDLIHCIHDVLRDGVGVD